MENCQIYYNRNMDKLWKSVLTEIELGDEISEFTFKTFFVGTTLISHSPESATIALKNPFLKKTFEVKYNQIIMDALKKVGAPTERLEFTSGAKKPATTETRSQKITADDLISKSPKKPDPRVSDLISSKTQKTSDNLKSEYTFENFVVGGNNDLAFHAAQAVAETPGAKYNPLFFYGNAGLGKTHLMQAIGNEIKKLHPEMSVLYVPADSFVKDYLESVRFKKQGYADKYRNVDVLIVDDMQFIAGKEKTQEEFFHTFNELHQANKQIIISSDRPPKSIPTLTDRLRTRFEWGMVIDIQMPDMETRQAIIQSKLAQSGFSMRDDVIEFLATNIRSNVRELEGILSQLTMIAQLRGIEIDVEMAQGMITKESRANRPQHLTDKKIIDKACKFYNVSKEDILGKSRTKDINHARQASCYMMRYELKMSFPQIGRIFSRDHSSIMNGVSKIEKMIKTDIEIREQIETLKNLIYE